MTTKYENSLFSSSFSELFSRKWSNLSSCAVKLPSNNLQYGHSVDTFASHFEEEEPFASLEEIEARTIGNLLPDDDELLSGVTDGLDINSKHTIDDAEELDFFSHVGGMDLEDDGSCRGQKYSHFLAGPGVSNGQSDGNGSVLGEHPHGEHPSRTLFVRNIYSNVEDSELQALFERYGEIHSLYTACKQRGFVMISYYDIRAAHDAMLALQGRPLQRRNLDIHYSIPKDNSTEKELNQGVLAVYDLDPSVSTDEVRHIFSNYGEIKEILDGPVGNQKYVEFYDTRAAEAAFHALNMSEIAGRRIKIQSVGHVETRRMMPHNQDSEYSDGDHFLQRNSPINHSIPAITSSNNQTALGMQSAVRAPFLGNTLHHGISSSVPSSLPSLVRVESMSKQSGFVKPVQPNGQHKYNIHVTPNFLANSLTEYQDALGGIHGIPTSPVNGNVSSGPPLMTNSRHMVRPGTEAHTLDVNQGVFGSAGNGSCPITFHQYMWGGSYHSQSPSSMMWQNSPTFVNGFSHPPPRMQGLLAGPTQLVHKISPNNNLHVGSAPAVNLMPWERQMYATESPEASSFHPGSLGNGRSSENSLQSMDFIHQGIFPHMNGNCMDLSMAPKVMAAQSPQRGIIFPGRGQMLPVSNSFDFPNERFRSRRNDSASNQTDNKKQFELDIDRIVRGEDKRTTLMIKNIPNKYTSKMLLVAIDERHKGTYDFLYLPIDFKNKCNVGYAFINMTDPSQIVAFYEAFNGKKWEKFNSEKVASLAYARIQGKSALIAHFQNSSLMNEDKRCRPILFNTKGPNAGDQVPFPIGVNIRTRPGKARAATIEENYQGSPPSGNGGESSKGNGFVSSGKDSE